MFQAHGIPGYVQCVIASIQYVHTYVDMFDYSMYIELHMNIDMCDLTMQVCMCECVYTCMHSPFVPTKPQPELDFICHQDNFPKYIFILICSLEELDRKGI